MMSRMGSTGPGGVLAAGELLWDLLPSGPRLGGAAANFTLGSARLGRNTALITCVGADDLGDRARQTLAERQQNPVPLPFRTDLIQTAHKTPTGCVQVTIGVGGYPRYVIQEPAAWDCLQATPEALLAASQAQAFCFGTLPQRAEASREAIRSLLQATPSECLRVLDTNIRAPYMSAEVVQWSLSHANLAKISDEELAWVSCAAGGSGLTAGGEPSLAAIEGCARELLALYPGLNLLAVTLGSRGSFLLTPTGADYHQGFSITVKDTVGAGDAFTAGLVHACLSAAPLAIINEVGNLCGSFVASHAGATPAFPPELLGRVAALLGPPSASSDPEVALV